MYAGANHLDNLCVMVDRNYGQLDIHNRMVFPMPDLEPVFKSFGWNVHNVDTTAYDGIYAALETFKFGTRNGRPTAIICHSTKGFGGQSDFMNKHKVTIPDALIAQEIALQTETRQGRVDEFIAFADSLEGTREGESIQEILIDMAREMHLDIAHASSGKWTVTNVFGPVLTKRVPPRDKAIKYDANLLPKLDMKKAYSAAEIVTGAMKVFSRDSRVVSIDSDLASTSGLEAGVGSADQKRALNVGVAEANMMLIGEAFAALGDNTWVSTFCPFFDWKVLRRIAVGHQERLEAQAAKDGWLSSGHGLDLTFLATAANFETRTNGATHMGNDDSTTFDAVAHLQIIDVSCPQQMLSIMKWIMAGNRGLVYVRVMRTPSAVLYGSDYTFDFGKGYVLKESPSDSVVIISAGRQVHESLGAAAKLAESGIHAGVVDMPSIDPAMLVSLYESGKHLVFAEQNNGFIWENFLKVLYQNRARLAKGQLKNVMTVNTLDKAGHAQFIHSATYEELVAHYGMTPDALASTIAGGLRS
jgi:transketolase